jgi:acetyltransferase-like isoleucine patch superfamily enzyme
LKHIIFYLLGNRPRAFGVFAAAYAPNALRSSLLKRLGVQNQGSIGRYVRFTNTAVRIEQGARIGNGCRFEGGAVITIAEGVIIAPRTVITTAYFQGRKGLRYDRPVTVAVTPDNSSIVIAPTREEI